jgi:Protein of unknown function (Hypoth_ymh)
MFCTWRAMVARRLSRPLGRGNSVFYFMTDDKEYIKQFAGISYLGLAGVSRSCIKAIMHLLMTGQEIRSAILLTSGKSHCVLLDCEEYDLVAVKSGFSSGYSGEGPTALELVLRLLDQRKIAIREVLVDSQVIARLDQSALKNDDIEFITNEKNIRRGGSWMYYVERENARHAEAKSLWRSFPQAIAFSQIDYRIQDLVIDFLSAPDSALLSGYRRLESIVRMRIGSEEVGSKLFSQAFQGATSKLTWKELDSGERNGRGSLFSAAFMAFRNPRAHEEKSKGFDSPFAELMLLNTLFLLEADAIKNEVTQSNDSCEK